MNDIEDGIYKCSRTHIHTIHTPTMERFKINMFQCIVKVKTEESIKILESTLQDIPHKCYAPGSLGKEVKDKKNYQIGSISMKCQLQKQNVSILLFNTHKMKISGGLNIVEEITNEQFESFFHQQIINPVIQYIYKREMAYELEKKMINATMYRSKCIGKIHFMEFIENLKKEFMDQQVIMPDIMIKNGNKRGRICAVKVKEKNGKGQFAVDHGGNVQFFSYDCLYSLQKHKSALMKVWL